MQVPSRNLLVVRRCKEAFAMICRAGLAIGVIVAGAAWSTETPCSAQSIGCYHMPSTVAQYFGYCYGAGHHAPIVKTPWQHPQRVQRMSFAPRQCGPLGPAPYEIYGCYGGQCSMSGRHAPMHAAPAEPPMPTPAEAMVEPGYRVARR
jgi:hypothetical protein